jgi:hypothetical protein
MLYSKGTHFPLRSAWSLRLASLAHRRVSEKQPGETPEPCFPAALDLTAALGLAFSGVHTSWIAVVGGGGLRTPFSAAFGLAAEFGFLLRVGMLCCVVVGGGP